MRRCYIEPPAYTLCGDLTPEKLPYDMSSRLVLLRAPIMPMLSLVGEEKDEYVIFDSFKSPLQGHETLISVEAQTKTLGIRLRPHNIILTSACEPQVSPVAIDLPNLQLQNENINPFVLWHSTETEDDIEMTHCIEVDPMLTRFLRDHQRVGVQFIFDCLMGLKSVSCVYSSGKPKQVTGCILADDMGLGKTLQSITILWTLLHQGFDKRPTVRKAVIVCPASLIKNWASEMDKWLKGYCKSTSVTESSKDKVITLFEGFQYDRESRVLITSYETLRFHGHRLNTCPIDFVICDEAHRLKNDKTKTALAISGLPCTRRLLLSGTPIQNDLEEFYALASLCIPELLGDAASFRKYFINPILIGRETDATDKEQQIVKQRVFELSQITNEFILRRTNTLLANLLPPKTIIVIFCKLTDTQKNLYHEFLGHMKNINSGTPLYPNTSGKQVLCYIQSLMKICNHPNLVTNTIHTVTACGDTLKTIDNSSLGRGTRLTNSTYYRSRSLRIDVSLSGKMFVLFSILMAIRSSNEHSHNKIVIISNFTQTIDMIELLLKEIGLSSVRLDGGTPVKKRHSIVTNFNNPLSSTFAFLLSSKAGGCGINLIGANRLVMFDPDWNPANDKQALARIWREGQQKECFVYRLFSTGTIEEKILQRQMRKDSLSSIVVSNGDRGNFDHHLASDEIDEVFTFNESTLCETHDLLQCIHCQQNTNNCQRDKVDENDFSTWTHHNDIFSVPDSVSVEAFRLSQSDKHTDGNGPKSIVSFAMSARIQLSKDNSFKDKANM